MNDKPMKSPEFFLQIRRFADKSFTLIISCLVLYVILFLIYISICNTALDVYLERASYALTDQMMHLPANFRTKSGFRHRVTTIFIDKLYYVFSV